MQLVPDVKTVGAPQRLLAGTCAKEYTGIDKKINNLIALRIANFTSR
jgi:hypothetical protein